MALSPIAAQEDPELDDRDHEKNDPGEDAEPALGRLDAANRSHRVGGRDRLDIELDEAESGIADLDGPGA